MAKYDIGELITALNDAVNKLNNLRVKYDDLEKERDALRAALQGLVNDLDDYPAVARLLDTYEYARAALEGKTDE